ncbi:MAG: carboxypeptidase regulatory-like domain-containing protein [Spirochaetales bacterium]|nr:carboxypeptidase regulatory-like domain-containing protein [Spirochaetales bacterium]
MQDDPIGSIEGKVCFSCGENHSGIIITAERHTDSETGVSKEKSFSVSVSLDSRAMTNSSGEYRIDGLIPGLYTVYAASTSSLEKAIAVDIEVQAGLTTTVPDLSLTAVGNISGKATLEGKSTGNSNIFVFIPETSYVGMTDDTGNYVIDSVPSGMSYTLTATKAGYFDTSTEVEVSINQTVTAEPLVLTPLPDPLAVAIARNADAWLSELLQQTGPSTNITESNININTNGKIVGDVFKAGFYNTVDNYLCNTPDEKTDLAFTGDFYINYKHEWIENNYFGTCSTTYVMVKSILWRDEPIFSFDVLAWTTNTSYDAIVQAAYKQTDGALKTYSSYQDRRYPCLTHLFSTTSPVASVDIRLRSASSVVSVFVSHFKITQDVPGECRLQTKILLTDASPVRRMLVVVNDENESPDVTVSVSSDNGEHYDTGKLRSLIPLTCPGCEPMIRINCTDASFVRLCGYAVYLGYE